MTVAVRAYIGLGSNLNNPAAQIRQALTALAALPSTRMLAHSHIYKSKPLGPPEQADFLNAAAILETQLEPLALLRNLHNLEEQQGRRRTRERRWGPRTLDLDILVYGELALHTPELTLPHPGVHLRSFVLYPLAELAPELVIPGHGSVRALRERCTSPAIEKYEEIVDD